MDGAITQAIKYGSRVDGTQKGGGWLGELKNPKGGVSTELSIQFDDVLQGRPIPLLVPGLTPQELEAVLSGGRPPRTAVEKAINHALERDAQGLSPFKD
jgi:hypothetical protein